MEAHEAHEQHEQLEQAAHGGHDGHGSHNKRIAILIAVLAALLAVVDSGGKGAQTEQVTANIKASDTWAFYQAKNIRQSVVNTSSALLQVLTPEAVSGEQAAKITKQLADWKTASDRLESSVETNGKKELMAKAHDYEEERDLALAAYHNFEFGGAALQLGIVLASASVITGMPALALAACGLGGLGAVLGGLGWFAPELLHHLGLG